MAAIKGPVNSPGSIAFVVMMVAVFFGMLFGLGGHFIRSAEWANTSIGVTAAITLPISMLLVRLAYRTGLKGTRFNLFHGAMFTALFFVFIGLFLFFSVAYTLPDLYTRNAGQGVELRGVEFTKHRSYGRGGCHYEIRALDFARAVRGHYCAGPSEFDALPDSGLARAYARRSWFGLHVYLVEPEPAVPKPLTRS